MPGPFKPSKLLQSILPLQFSDLYLKRSLDDLLTGYIQILEALVGNFDRINALGQFGLAIEAFERIRELKKDQDLCGMCDQVRQAFEKPEKLSDLQGYLQSKELKYRESLIEIMLLTSVQLRAPVSNARLIERNASSLEQHMNSIHVFLQCFPHSDVDPVFSLDYLILHMPVLLDSPRMPSLKAGLQYEESGEVDLVALLKDAERIVDARLQEGGHSTVAEIYYGNDGATSGLRERVVQLDAIGLVAIHMFLYSLREKSGLVRSSEDAAAGAAAPSPSMGMS